MYPLDTFSGAAPLSVRGDDLHIILAKTLKNSKNYALKTLQAVCVYIHYSYFIVTS